jgi:hypothetical protein
MASTLFQFRVAGGLVRRAWCIPSKPHSEFARGVFTKTVPTNFGPTPHSSWLLEDPGLFLKIPALRHDSRVEVKRLVAFSPEGNFCQNDTVQWGLT